MGETWVLVQAQDRDCSLRGPTQGATQSRCGQAHQYHWTVVVVIGEAKRPMSFFWIDVAHVTLSGTETILDVDKWGARSRVSAFDLQLCACTDLDAKGLKMRIIYWSTEVLSALYTT